MFFLEGGFFTASKEQLLPGTCSQNQQQDLHHGDVTRNMESIERLSPGSKMKGNWLVCETWQKADMGRARASCTVVVGLHCRVESCPKVR